MTPTIIGDCTLYHGDCLKVMPTLEAGSVDAILTDPPYLRQFLPLYGALAERAPRVLSDGGSLMAIVPHYGLAEVVPAVSAHLKWRWLMCMWQDAGPHPRMAMGIEVLWKPVGWWVKNRWKQGQGFVRDGFEVEHEKKSLHEWQQSLSWAEYCLSVTRNQPVVCDPFMGAGTMGVACVKAGRPFIGIELDAGYFETACERIEKVFSELSCPVRAGQR